MSFKDMVESAAAAGEWKQELKATPESRGVWASEEHRLFVDGIKMFPSGPWKDIANHVGTRTARQTMTHAQKYRQKIARRLRNVRMSGKHSPTFLMEQSSRFSALLCSDEQFNDSILATSLAIAAEGELEMLGETGEGYGHDVELKRFHGPK
ncbi:myb-like dna-binding [Plasmopara halstedii]|uniref:Myb-like dna-binding n=1 Tax=Plasmopara halstedii TaxID=4781 RepID=A0A0P1B420_PLAHL|nr:myb-like dna-binding [Plasmopara halstedii]CEG49038.1 myb-like dna-binding [Plasmopara halstedii]|eukprot:XP_024585407.1 myb-like dna-binding [Plasmopara halstedii]